MTACKTMRLMLESGDRRRRGIGNRIGEPETGTSKVVKCCERMSKSTCIAAEGTQAGGFADEIGPDLMAAPFGRVGKIGSKRC